MSRQQSVVKERIASNKMEERKTVAVTHRFNAAAERVFDAWLDPNTVGLWLFSTPTGRMTKVEIDARVGGIYSITENRDGEDIEHTGQYLKLDRPRRLVFTFKVPKFSSEGTTVTLEITSLKNACELTLTHEGVLPDYASRTQEGWSNILSKLAVIVETSS